MSVFARRRKLERLLTVLLPIQVDRMLTPGAKMSTMEPKLEKEAILSLLSVAPTVKTVGSEAGETLAASWASLPAAMARKRPAVTALAAALLTLVDLEPPRDMLPTAPPLQAARVFWSLAAKLIPAMTPELVPEPEASRTLTAKRLVFLATP
jgi:hypothetical protein